MDFASRFKGRTNLFTKEGIFSTITENSSPIQKDLPPVELKFKNR